MSDANLEKAIRQIKDAGFSHIKVELEADLGRDGDRYCSNCDEGSVSCDTCDSEGYVDAERPNGSTVEVECDECDGEGYTSCHECDGEGYVGGYYDEDWCDEFIRENVSQEARDHLTYGEFYEDGSVDSEFTFTIPIEHAAELPQWIEAFKKIGEETGNGVDTSGAGMHISVIPDYARGSYPVSRAMPSANINNFIEQTTKLLPALFFLASPDEVSRELGYRNPQVDAREKYSAIYTHSNTCIEFRLFETTYKEPTKIFEHIQVIAKTLEFYKDPSKKVETLGKQFGFNGGYGKVERFYNTPEKIDILRKQLKYIRPDGRTISELFAERKVPMITELKRKQSKRVGELRREYYRTIKYNEELKKQPITPRIQEHIDSLKYERERGWCDMTDEQIENQARGLNVLPAMADYINRNLNGGSSDRFAVSV